MQAVRPAAAAIVILDVRPKNSVGFMVGDYCESVADVEQMDPVGGGNPVAINGSGGSEGR